jgi:hypothetical protein
MIVFGQTSEGFFCPLKSGKCSVVERDEASRRAPLFSGGALWEDGMNIMIPTSELLDDELMRPNAAQIYSARDHALANFIAEILSILHPATLPMLERMFEDVKQDAENDGELELKWRAEIGIAAARIALREQQAVEG